MATGESFMRIGNSRQGIDELKAKIQQACSNWWRYIKLAEDEDFEGWNCDEEYRLQGIIKELEYDLYRAEELDRINRNWNNKASCKPRIKKDESKFNECSPLWEC